MVKYSGGCKSILTLRATKKDKVLIVSEKWGNIFTFIMQKIYFKNLYFLV